MSHHALAVDGGTPATEPVTAPSPGMRRAPAQIDALAELLAAKLR